MIKVSFIKSPDRQYNIKRCLSLLSGEIKSSLRKANHVVIKPSCVIDDNQLASTHADALIAVLDFIRPYIKGQVILAEGTGIGKTIDAFHNYGYLRLQDQYDLEIVDLNTDESEPVTLIDKRGIPITGKIAKTLLKADYVISVSPPKTHNSVVYTGAVKNVSVGGLTKTYGKIANLPFFNLNNYKTKIHQGSKAINENIARIFKKIPPMLAVLDGFESMEGNGPINGDLVSSHFAIASCNPLAADWLACKLMGIELSDVGYLTLLGLLDKSDFFVTGDEWESNIDKFKMHSDFEKIRHWQ